MLWLVVLLACRSEEPPEPYVFPSPTDAPAWRGAGGPQVAFGPDELFEHCAYLVGPEKDLDFRNTVMPYRGHMVMPWAAEWGNGGLSFYDMADPCEPERVADSYHLNMRETHAIGFVHLPDEDPNAGDWAVVNASRGVLTWNHSDLSDIQEGQYLELENVFWPDAYARVAFNVFWQYPYVFVGAADNGLVVVDATDPTAMVEVARLQLDPPIRAGGVYAFGNRLLIVSAEQTEAAMIDISEPTAPQLFAGGRFTITDRDGQAREAYSGNFLGDVALFARKDSGGGPIVFDVSNPNAPAFYSDLPMEGASGGYLYYDEGYIFIGQSNRADIIDATQLDAMTPLATLHLEGDQDTLTPYGNVAVLSVDDGGVKNEASAVVPWTEAPDTSGPRVRAFEPADGAENVPLTARIGIGFNEIVEPSSVFPGSVRLFDDQGGAVPGWAGAQEALGWYTPHEPLKPGTTYTFEVLAGGVMDANGNPVDETVVVSFTTAGSR